MTETYTLAVDIGNTTVHLGLFRSAELDTTWSLKTDTSKEADDYGVALLVLLQRHGLDPACIGHAVIGSVVPPLTGLFEDLLARYCGVEPLVVRGGTKTGVRLLYDPLFELGADRIAHAVAAERLYRTPAVVVDFGTATVFDAIGQEGMYLGGAIAPGLTIASDALWERTAQIRRIDFRFPQRPIGRNTTEAVQSGLLFGCVGLTKEMIVRFGKEMEHVECVIATGKHAALIAPHVPEIAVVDENLALKGLRLIYELNQPGPKVAEKVHDAGTTA